MQQTTAYPVALGDNDDDVMQHGIRVVLVLLVVDHNASANVRP